MRNLTEACELYGDYITYNQLNAAEAKAMNTGKLVSVTYELSKKLLWLYFQSGLIVAIDTYGDEVGSNEDLNDED